LEEIGEGVLLCVSGMGSDRAARAARELLDAGATALVSAGVAGGLDPTLAPGALVIADRVLAAEGHAFATDVTWRAALASRLHENHLECVIAAMVESPGVLTTTAEKQACFRDTGAAAVDMESAAIALEAARASVPFLVLRSVCDAADMCIPRCALVATDPQGKPRLALFLSALLRHPGELADVVRLQRAFRKAQQALSTAARLAGARLCATE
jgi:hopanoid-associated phosphorylase